MRRRRGSMGALIVLVALVGALGACSDSPGVTQGKVTGPDAADAAADAVADAPDAAAKDAAWPALDAAPPLGDACSSSDAALVTPAACPAATPPWWTARPAPAPSLQLDIGSFDVAKGEFTPWAQGQWAPMHLGMRTGFGVWAVIAVKLPAGTPDPVALHVAADGLVGCDVVGSTVTKTMKFHHVSGSDGLYVNASALVPGGACVLVTTGSGPDKALAMCGQWMTIRAQVGTQGGAWGEATRVVRLYGFRNPP